MSELGEIFSALKEMKKEKKISNLEKSIQLLDANNIDYEVLSDTHYRISNFDFWPSTGLFTNRKTSKKGRGVFNLLRNLQKAATKEINQNTPVKDMTQDCAAIKASDSEYLI